MSDSGCSTDRLEALGCAGFTVSICCGPCGSAPFRWTVQVMNARGQEFNKPFAATSFVHAIEIAEIEIIKRGWIAKAVHAPMCAYTSTNGQWPCSCGAVTDR